MEEVIVIRIIDSDGSAFASIMNALLEKQYKIVDMSVIDRPAVNIGKIKIYPSYKQVSLDGQEIHLNYSEYAMLYCMAKAPGRVYTREQLYAAAWENEVYPYGSNTVENTIFRLQQKLEPDPKHPVYIKTVFRTGYKVEDPSRA